MKEKLKRKVEKRFKNVTFSKIILYKNPDEFRHVFLERVNPDHIGILWGKRKKKFNKGSHYIKWGKVYFSFIPVIIGLSTTAYIDMITYYTYNLLVTVGLFGFFTVSLLSIMLYWIPFKMGASNCQTC